MQVPPATLTRPISAPRARRSLVVLVGDAALGERHAQALAASLAASGVETIQLGREHDARRIAALAAEHEADAIEVCVAGAQGVSLVHELLRELIALGRRDVRIVVHNAAV
jgi:methylmalonyl-CoA mutase cobalamin-binding subunit